jgi:hypothetical protein
MTPPCDRRREIARRVLDPVGTAWPAKGIGEATVVSRPHRPRGSVAGGAQESDEVARDDALGRSARRMGDNRTRGSVRHRGARVIRWSVLSQDRVDRWRASSGRTPSSVTRAGVETTAACEAKARDGKGRRFRYRTPSLSTVPRIPSRVALSVRCTMHRALSLRDATNLAAHSSRLHDYAPVGTR